MQDCSRSILARIYQQTVRLRRQTDAIARLLPTSTTRKTSTRRTYITFSSLRQAAAPTRAPPRHHVVSGTPQREQYYVAKIPLPDVGAGIEAWVQNLEVALPPNLRTVQARGHVRHVSYTGQDLACYLVAAYTRHEQYFDLLSHLGLEQGRWQTVMWIVNTLIDEGDPYERAINTPSASPLLEWHCSQSLQELTRSPFGLEQAALEVKTPTMRSFVDFSPRLPDMGWTYHKGALGMVWRALGTMILSAAAADKAARDELMPHVLEIIAVFHLHGIIPDAVYQPTVSNEPLTLQQPPTLHLLSNQILTALSDAAWRAQDSSNAIRSKATGAQYDFLGNEMPGTEYRAHVAQLRPEVWLELVLWSCLHGGWIEEGTSILMSPQLGIVDGEWSLISWSDELLQSQDTTAPEEVSFLSLFGWPATDKKRDIEKTLSSELVVAYIDALVNIVRLGIGERGMAASQVLAKVKNLKAMLDKHSLGLGTVSWDAVVLRLLETGGVNAKQNPAFLQEVLGLVQPFARELKLANTANAKVLGRSAIPYTFEPSAAVLGLLHEAIRAHIKLGNVPGALRAFQELQAFTDSNKKRSMEEFFKTLRDDAESNREDSYSLASLWQRNASEGFTSNVTQLAASYPNFYPQIPKALLASLLDLATSAQAFEFAGWLLYSEDADGPLVSEQEFADTSLGPALIRYATAVRNKELLQKVIARQSTRASQSSHAKLHPQVLKAFLVSQIELRRWLIVERILRQFPDRSERVCDSETVAFFARELMYLEGDSTDVDGASRQKARAVFANLTLQRYGRHRGPPSDRMVRVDSILGFLSSLGTDWFEYCADLRPLTSPHPLRFSNAAFVALLQGTVHAYGSVRAMQVWQQWHWPVASDIEPPRKQYAKANDKGVPKLPALRYDRGRDYDPAERTIYVESPTPELPPYVFHNKMKPTVDSVRTIVRGAAAERAAMSMEELETSRAAYQDLAKHAIAALRHMGLDKDDIALEMEQPKL